MDAGPPSGRGSFRPTTIALARRAVYVGSPQVLTPPIGVIICYRWAGDGGGDCQGGLSGTRIAGNQLRGGVCSWKRFTWKHATAATGSAGPACRWTPSFWHLCKGCRPKPLWASVFTLTLEQVYGAIAYYLAHRTEIDSHLKKADAEFESLARARCCPGILADAHRSALADADCQPMKVRFQADADLNEILAKAALCREPGIDFQTASAARLAGLSDQEVLASAARSRDACW